MGSEKKNVQIKTLNRKCVTNKNKRVKISRNRNENIARDWRIKSRKNFRRFY